MSEIVNFYYSRCDKIMLDQITGYASYMTPAFHRSVGQLIAPQAINEFCSSFSIEIIDCGASDLIGIGLCHKNYSRCNQPGWYENTIGYHADNGGIYDDCGMSMESFGRVNRGEVMECSFDFETNTVTFLRNGETVYTTRSLNIPEDGFYPIVGLHSHGEEIRLREMEPWSLDPHGMSLQRDVVYHSMGPRGATVSQASGIVRRTSQSGIGQFVSKCPLTPDVNSFSVEIACVGEKSSISIGICHRLFPNKCQPGWLKNTIAYHVGDKAVYNGFNEPHPCGSKVKSGDILACEMDFENMTCTFKKNGGVIYRSPSMKPIDGGYHAVIGLSQSNDAVCLLEKNPWRLKNEMIGYPIAKQIYHFSSCTGVTLDQNNGILSFIPDASTGQLISNCQLSSEVNKFSIEIKNPGRRGRISIGLCPAPSQGDLGRSTVYTTVYLAGDGMVCNKNMKPVSVARASQGDVISCEFKTMEKMVIFLKNEEKIHESTIHSVPPEGLFAAVSLGSEFESVRLCEKEPWRKDDMSNNVEDIKEPRTMPKCCVCMDNGVTRFFIPCGHTFCLDCTTEWTQHHRTCPACRAHYKEIKMLFY